MNVSNAAATAIMKPGRIWSMTRRHWFVFAVVLVFAGVGFLIWLSVDRVRDQGGYSNLLAQNFETRRQIGDIVTRKTTGVDGEAVTALFATAEYFRTANLVEEAARYQPERNAAFLVTQEVHSGSLSPAPWPVLWIDGRHRYLPTDARVLAESLHHRAVMFTYSSLDGSPLITDSVASVAVVVDPQGTPGSASTMRWELPISYENATSRPTFSWAMILAIMGGLLASMWPCLFQLTAFFIPSLAGVSMEQAHGKQPIAKPVGIVKTALVFVLGFVIVYTAAGALAGLAAQSLSGSATWDAARQPLAIGGGVIIILLALRVAARSRVPLVCKMPIVSWGTRTGKPQGYVATMITGLAFATGCMTCFGAALALGMLTYVGTSGSVVTGALVLFLFSLGMGIPLVIGAALMARALPLIGKLQTWAPAMAIVSSGIMIAFGLLMITGNYHVISDVFLSWAGVT